MSENMLPVKFDTGLAPLFYGMDRPVSSRMFLTVGLADFTDLSSTGVGVEFFVSVLS